jgi:hypothetical protein
MTQHFVAGTDNYNLTNLPPMSNETVENYVEIEMGLLSTFAQPVPPTPPITLYPSIRMTIRTGFTYNFYDQSYTNISDRCTAINDINNPNSPYFFIRVSC